MKANIRFITAATGTVSFKVIGGAKQYVFGHSILYNKLPPGRYLVEVLSNDDGHSPLMSANIDVSEGNYYTFCLTSAKDTFQSFLFTDYPSVPEGESAIRFIHLAEPHALYDIAITEGDVVFASLSYSEASHYLPVYPMKVQMEIRISGRKEVILPLPNTLFHENKPSTIYLVKPHNRNQTIKSLTLHP
ncbi:DUF4397 domain-containing protein [Bacillus massiliglaciei]|uniref:DUF4397 domain-containing protein n=1 Tax=Bacillus massiliglaciei TaxID=1816693 RepID=UPI000DA6216F|nr:DUF4397 domain-containing protein [Bacillus massiliglaciei]